MISFCSGVPNRSSRLPSVLPETQVADLLAEVADELAGVGLDAADDRVHLRAQVVGHPRHRGELHPVGLLVQAHPEPEVVRVGAELALDVDDVGRHQQQPAVLAGTFVEGVELAEHLRAEEAQHRAQLGAGDPRADGLGRASPARPGRWSASRSAAPISAAKPSVLAWIQPGRSTTSTGAVRSVATRPVNSRTSGRGAVGALAQLLDDRDRLGPARPGAPHRRDGTPP